MFQCVCVRVLQRLSVDIVKAVMCVYVCFCLCVCVYICIYIFIYIVCICMRKHAYEFKLHESNVYEYIRAHIHKKQ